MRSNCARHGDMAHGKILQVYREIAQQAFSTSQQAAIHFSHLSYHKQHHHYLALTIPSPLPHLLRQYPGPNYTPFHRNLSKPIETYRNNSKPPNLVQ